MKNNLWKFQAIKSLKILKIDQFQIKIKIAAPWRLKILVEVQTLLSEDIIHDPRFFPREGERLISFLERGIRIFLLKYGFQHL